MTEAQKLFRSLSSQYDTPWKVQQLIYGLEYNLEPKGDTVRSASLAWNYKQAHCLEASFLAAAILEWHGYPPTVLSLESADRLDHVLFVFKERTGWGAISRSKEPGLHGRAPVFESLRDLAWSYIEPFVDETGRLLSYGLACLDDTKTRWRDSKTNVWKAEQYLVDLKHTRLDYPETMYRRALVRFRRTSFPCERKSYWW